MFRAGECSPGVEGVADQVFRGVMAWYIERMLASCAGLFFRGVWPIVHEGSACLVLRGVLAWY